MGDMVLLIPMLKVLHQRYGQPCELVSSGGWTAPLMDRVPATGKLTLITSRRMPYLINRSQQQLVSWLRKRPQGPVYVFEVDEKTHWLLRRGGIRAEWICSLCDLPRAQGENILQHAVRLAQMTPSALRESDAYAAATPFVSPNARPTITEADRRDCVEWLTQRGVAGRPLVLIQPGNKKTMRRGARNRATNVKYWPEASWAEVIRTVRQFLPESRVLICGSPTEYDLAASIRQQSGGEGVLVVCDDLPIPRLLALQEVAHSMISVDTGPAHSAAAMGCPLAVMFARIDPELYAPTPTSGAVKIIAAEGDIESAPMTSITADRVIAAWRALPGR